MIALPKITSVATIPSLSSGSHSTPHSLDLIHRQPSEHQNQKILIYNYILIYIVELSITLNISKLPNLSLDCNLALKILPLVLDF